MSKQPAKSAGEKEKLYNLSGELVRDAELKKNSNQKEYALARVKGKDGKETTIMTYVPGGIAALKDKKAGDKVRLYGTFEKGKDGKGQTFSAMGVSKPKEKAAPDSPSI